MPLPPPPPPPLAPPARPPVPVRRPALPAHLVLGCALLALAGLLLFQEHTAQAMRQRQEDDLLVLLADRLQQTYAHVLGERRLLLQEREARLNQTAAVARRLAGFALHAANRQDLLPHERQVHAGTLALALIDDAFLEPDALCFVYDGRITALTYPEIALRGLDLSPYRDRHGRSLLRSLRDEAMQWGHSSAIFDWKARGAARMTRHLGLAVHLPEFDWTLAVFLDLDDLLRRERELRTAQVNALLQTLGTLHDANSAVYCLLDSRGRLLGAPVSHLPATAPLARAVLETNMLADPEVQARLLVATLAEGTARLDDLPGNPGPILVRGVQHPALGWILARLSPAASFTARRFWVPITLSILGLCCVLLPTRRSLQARQDAS